MQNETLLQFFEWYCPADGAHWNRFKEQVDQLVAMGITAVWLPPAYKGIKGMRSEGYDVYDIYDLGEFDQKGNIATKYGTKQQYIDAVTYAQKKGLKVYVDVVLNHMGGAEEKETMKVRKVDTDNRLEFISDEMEIEAYTRFTFPGRNGQYSSFVWDKHCFTGVDFAANTEEKAIFNIINEYGDTWEPLTNNEKGNFDYLMLNDIETRNPAVREELKRWIKWYHDTVPFNGVRLDAVKHINPAFFIEWIDYLKKEVDPNAFVLGEYWLSDDLPVLLKYLDVVGGRMHLFDAPLHHNLSQASEQKEAYDLRAIFKETLIDARPEHAVTFVDNHDTQPLQSLEEFTQQWFKPHAYALILLREKGYPCVFYPDIYSSRYTGKNKADEDCEIDLPVIEELQGLLALRRDYAYGEQQDYFDDANCIGWVRRGIEERPSSGCAVILTNKAQRYTRRMQIGKQFAGKTCYDYLQHCHETVTIDAEGYGDFFVEPGSVSVWVVRG